uniref:Uncharacterized protein n=2 Tax=Pseudo-nitzschia australis TaxID=44445 RepID=A0A6V0ASH8_9STRA
MPATTAAEQEERTSPPQQRRRRSDERRRQQQQQKFVPDDGCDDDDDNKFGESDYSNTQAGRQGGRHWKDRAEERLDRILGVHEVGGKTYDRWSRKEKLDTTEDIARGYDAVSYAKGHRRPPRERRRRRNAALRNDEKPFWEQKGPILSVLLGHSNWDDSRPSQRSLRSNLDDVVEGLRSSRTMTALLRNLLLVCARIIGSLCRWASVRDTIPRPVVFSGAIAAGLVSRPGDRIKSVLLTLLSVRVLGEWLSEPVRAPRTNPSGSSRHDDDDDDDYDDGDHDNHTTRSTINH